MTLQRLSDGKFSRYHITEQSQGAGWRTLDIDYIGGSAAVIWTYNDILTIIITPVGDIGVTGLAGPTGAAGPGVPLGGLNGQVLKKIGINDYETEWGSLPSTGIDSEELISLVSYPHTQGSASAIWTVNHSLGFYPSVTVFLSTGDVVEGALTHTDINTASIAFSTPISGTAYLS